MFFPTKHIGKIGNSSTCLQIVRSYRDAGKARPQVVATRGAGSSWRPPLSWTVHPTPWANCATTSEGRRQRGLQVRLPEPPRSRLPQNRAPRPRSAIAATPVFSNRPWGASTSTQRPSGRMPHWTHVRPANQPEPGGRRGGPDREKPGAGGENLTRAAIHPGSPAHLSASTWRCHRPHRGQLSGPPPEGRPATTPGPAAG
jgi:hypothetical protein